MTFDEWFKLSNYDKSDALTRSRMMETWDSAIDQVLKYVNYWLRDPQNWDLRFNLVGDINSIRVKKPIFSIWKDLNKK